MSIRTSTLLAALLLVPAAPAQLQFACALTPTPSAASGLTGEGQLHFDLSTNSLRFRVATVCVAPATCYSLLLTGGPFTSPNSPVVLSSICGYFGLPVAPEMYEGTWTGATPEVVRALLAGQMSLSVGYGSVLFPTTIVMSGTILPATERRFSGTLSAGGLATPTGSSATAIASLTLEEAERRILYDVDASGLVGFVGSLWVEPPGAPPVYITALNGGPLRFAGRSELLTPAQCGSILAYGPVIRIHTGAFPSGEIGGLLSESPTETYAAVLKGAEAIPPVVTGATGFARISLDRATAVATYEIQASGFVAQEARVELAAPGQPAIASIVVPSTGPGTWSYTTPPQTPALIDALRKGLVAVTVTDAAHPQGLIRGQMRRTEQPYGFGSETGNGVAQIGMRGEHRLGNPDWAPVLFHAPPATLAYLVVGFGASSFQGQPLPLDLNSGGTMSQRAFMWIDPSGGFFVPVTTDSLGTAAVPLPLDFPQAAWASLTGLEAFYQWLVLSGPAAAGFSVSNALRLVLH
jgi:hypothetical protein